MQHTITSRLFFFNTDTDYLPYYKSYTVTIDEDKTLADLLQAYAEQIRDYSVASMVSVNSILVDDSLSIQTLVEAFGCELEIEPISAYRANKDLQIDNEDFLAKVELLGDFCDESDLEYYKTLSKVYYASSSLKYNESYFGDALFLLAHRLITNSSTNKEAILKIINHPENGLPCYEAENNTLPLLNVDEIVSELKDMIQADIIPSPAATLLEKIKNRIIPNSAREQIALKNPSTVNFSKLTLKKSFQGFKIAFYTGLQSDYDHTALLDFTEASEINFASQNKASGLDIIQTAPKIASLKASDIITDAFDRSADILVVNHEEQRVHLSSKKSRNATSRTIELQIITAAQLLEIALGNTDKKSLGLDKAKITFI